MDRAHPETPGWPGGETAIVVGVWLTLALISLLAFPVADLPASLSSWDVMHSGRQFADRGFVASRLQPRWSPYNDPAPYVTYTHYPPLPYWISGVVQSLVTTPQARIHAMLYLIRLLGLSALLVGYVLLRQLQVTPVAATVTMAALTWSLQWWIWISGELSWCSWCPFFLLAATTVMVWGVGRDARTWRLALATGIGCATAAALSAFDAWLWTPTFLVVLWCLVSRRSTQIRSRLAIACVLACASTGIAVGTRGVINWWHFGSLASVVRDLREAYEWRSASERPAGLTGENAINYKELPHGDALSHRQWITTALTTLPRTAMRAYLPRPPYGWWLAWCTLLLAVPSCWAGWLARRHESSPEPASTLGPWQVLLALLAAPLAFVIACPAINAQQPWGVLGQGPAMIVLAGLVINAAARTLRTVATTLAWSTLVPRVVMAVLALAAIVVRLPAAQGARWPRPLAETQAAVEAVADLDGMVFVNIPNTNALMYLVPIESRLALKIAALLPAAYFKNTKPVRLLWVDAIEPDHQPDRRAVSLMPPRPLPSGWRLLLLGE